MQVRFLCRCGVAIIFSSTIKTKGKTMSKGNKARELLDLAHTIISESDERDNHADWLREARTELGIGSELTRFEASYWKTNITRIEGPKVDDVANMLFVAQQPEESRDAFTDRVQLAVDVLNEDRNVAKIFAAEQFNDYETLRVYRFECHPNSLLITTNATLDEMKGAIELFELQRTSVFNGEMQNIDTILKDRGFFCACADVVDADIIKL
jgi:hypothetical protein